MVPLAVLVSPRPFSRLPSQVVVAVLSLAIGLSFRLWARWAQGALTPCRCPTLRTVRASLNHPELGALGSTTFWIRSASRWAWNADIPDNQSDVRVQPTNMDRCPD